MAQASAEEGANDRNAEIIVTARKQAELILEVPVVESVLTEEAIERYQINDIQDVVSKVPGLFSGNLVLAIGEMMSLRGVGSNSLNQGVDQSVSLNIDGLSVTHGLAYRAATFDLQQVEVFKGPQALYYGKNATAGVISLRSADPGDKLELIGRLGYEFEAAEKRGELIVSAPLGETLGVRIAGLYSDVRGSGRNTATALPGFGGKDPKLQTLRRRRELDDPRHAQMGARPRFFRAAEGQSRHGPSKPGRRHPAGQLPRRPECAAGRRSSSSTRPRTASSTARSTLSISIRPFSSACATTARRFSICGRHSAHWN